MERRRFLRSTATGVAGAVLLPSCAPQQPARAAAAPRRPNIILILADDLGYAELGVQGCRDIPTPHIDSLARHGVRFTSGYVSCPLCSPSRAGLLTGRYQQRFGHEFNPGPQQAAAPEFGLDADEVTLAERLRPFGYATGMVGKWHLGFRPEVQPTARGFGEFFGFLEGANSYVPDPARRVAGPIMRGTEPVEEAEYLTDAFGREAVAFIERHREEPFFLYLPFNAVHAPLQASPQYLDRFGDLADQNRRTFAAMLSALDDNVGRVLTTLRDLSLEEETLVVFLSDNGGPTARTTSSNTPLRGYKAQMWEGGLRVPFILQWQGHVPADRVYRLPVSSLDLHATCVAAAGEAVATEWRLDGEDLLPYLTGHRTGRPHETLYWRMGEQHAVRHGDWKLVVTADQTTPGLYNLAEDLAEQHDLAAQRPDTAAELGRLYETWAAELEEPRWGPQGARANRQQGGAVRQRFQQLDRNGDGQLTPDELPRPRLFRRLDANGDGVLTLDEARAGLPGRQGTGGQQ